MGALDGKVAVVTGGASGIGFATAKAMADAGASVVLADVNAADGTKAAADLGGLFLRTDVGDPHDWVQLVDHTTRELGGIDVVHLNAGVTTGVADITALTDDQYRRVMRPNIDGVVFGVRAVVPALRARGGGAIVATASLAGIVPFAPDPIYTLTKHAVVGFVRSLAQQLEPHGITINAVCPGIVDTPLVGEGRERLRAAGFPLIPPSAIADAVLGCVTGTDTGQCFVCQPDRAPEAYEFHGVPGPRTPGAEGRRPPNM